MSQILEANSRLPIDQLILDAAKESNLRWLQKRRVEAAVYFKGPLYDRLVSEVQAALYVEELIDEDGRALKAIDWAAILAVIIPLLLEWFSGRFGSRR